jgi:signal transduction histidine kinase
VRLVALFLLLALGMSATFLLGMQSALRIGWRDAARPLVSDYVDRLVTELGSPPQVERAQSMVQHLPLSIRIQGPQVNWRSHPDLGEYYEAPDEPRDNRAPRFFERSTADGHRIRFGVNVQAWHDRPRLIGWATLAALLLLTALAYARVRRMLRPLDDIRAGARRFGAGDFAQPIPVRQPQRPDELGELAATINTMGADIGQMLDAKRALLLAISHELRSPLTRARLNTELLPVTPELQASRQALATEVVAGLAGAPPVRLTLAPGLPLLALDRSRLRLLLRNLLDNAVRYSQGQAQPPVLTLQVEPAANSGAGPGLRLTVRDHGPGVPEAQLAQLAQPFFRPDAARSRSDGGVGLGLYLCRLVAEAHGGRLQLRNAAPGLEVTVTLPGYAI